MFVQIVALPLADLPPPGALEPTIHRRVHAAFVGSFLQRGKCARHRSRACPWLLCVRTCTRLLTHGWRFAIWLVGVVTASSARATWLRLSVACAVVHWPVSA
eukprot:7607329-Alexandrium_andersonii.AAC.1